MGVERTRKAPRLRHFCILNSRSIEPMISLLDWIILFYNDQRVIGMTNGEPKRVVLTMTLPRLCHHKAPRKMAPRGSPVAIFRR